MKVPPFLLVLLGAALSANAASTVLYETGWEADPAMPAWVPGNLIGQNAPKWAASPAAANDRNRVVANGTLDADPFGTPVATPTGTQFHRFRASTATAAANQQYAWPDITSEFLARPVGQNLIVSSIDIFVPSGDSADASFYGLLAFDYVPALDDFFLDYGFLLQPSTRRLLLVVDGGIVDNTSPEFFAYDTWFNVALHANYQNGDLDVLYNGTPVPGFAQDLSELIVDAQLTDVDLFSQNATNLPQTRIIFSDNYRITAESVAPVLPRLTMTPLPPDNVAYRIKWPAANSNWILEFTDALLDSGSAWAPQGTPPTAELPTDPGYDPLLPPQVYVDIAIEALHRYFRLRQP